MRINKLIRLNAQVIGLTDLISTVIDQEYPNSVKDDLTDLEYKVKKKYKRGRNLDKSAPQDEIHNRVIELIEMAKSKEPGYKNYWHHDGQYKGTPNKNRIADQLFEDGLGGNVTKKTLRRRIEKVFKAWTK